MKCNPHMCFVLLFFVLAAVSSGCGNENPTQQKNVPNKKTEDVIQGAPIGNGSTGDIAQIHVGNRVFKIPKNYVRQNPADGRFFSIAMSWPSMLPVPDKPADSYPVDYIEVLVVGLERNNQQVLRTLDERLSGGAYSLSVGVPTAGLLGFRYSGTNTDTIFVPVDTKKHKENGQRYFLVCESVATFLSEPNSKRCSVSDVLANSIGIEYRFYIKNIENWDEIRLSVLEFLNSHMGDK